MGHIHDVSSSSYYNKQAFENVDGSDLEWFCPHPFN